MATLVLNYLLWCIIWFPRNTKSVNGTLKTENEKEGRFIFYGAMIGEGVIALVWCAVGFKFL